MNHLVIPNYNGRKNIENVLTIAALYKFDSITVCDDCSTDGSVEIIRKKFPFVNILSGKNRLGPGGNRSRVLRNIGEGRLIHESDLIYFLDVDMQIEEIDVKNCNRYFDKNPHVAIVGGLILTKKKDPMWWNYGFEMHPCRSAKESAFLDSALLVWNHTENINAIRTKASSFTYNLEMTFGNRHTIRNVDWVSEANFVIRGSVFKQIRGFDSKMWYHADQDLCKRVRNIGLKIVYNPFVKVKHLEIDTFGKKRGDLVRENAWYFYKKHYNISRALFDYLFDSD